MNYDITAYCDECEAADSVYCIAGYTAPSVVWEGLRTPWQAALDGAAFREFKMSATEGLPRTQGNFIWLLTSHDLHAFVTIMDLRAYSAVESEMSAKRTPDYQKAYFLAFQHEVEMMALYPSMQKLPSNERIRFVFDKQSEYEGRAAALYE